MIRDKNIRDNAEYIILHEHNGKSLLRDRAMIKNKIRTKIVREQSVGGNFLVDKLKKETKFSGVHPKDFRVFLRMVKRSIFRSWMNDNCRKDLVDSIQTKKHRNRDNWDKLTTGDTFYLIDMVSCYWQMAYKLGYIDKELFDRFMYNDEYKQAKRLCFTLLKKNVIVGEQFKGDVVINNYICDSSLINDIFFNVRNISSVYISELVGLINKDYLFFNVDGIAVTQNRYQEVSKFFKDNDIKVSVNICSKTVNNNYVVNDKSKRV
jgi:hypothetical protein